MNDKVISLNNLATFKEEVDKYINGPGINYILAMNLGVYSSDEISTAIGGADGFNTLFSEVKRTNHIHLVNPDTPGAGEWDCFNVSTFEQGNMKNLSFTFIADGLNSDSNMKAQLTYDGDNNVFYGFMNSYATPGVVASYGDAFASFINANEQTYFKLAGEYGLHVDMTQAMNFPDGLTGTLDMIMKTTLPILEDSTVARQDLYIPGGGDKEHFMRTITNISSNPVFSPWQNVSETSILRALGLLKVKRNIRVGDNLKGQSIYFDIPGTINDELTSYKTTSRRNVQVGDDLSGKTLYLNFPDSLWQEIMGDESPFIQTSNEQGCIYTSGTMFSIGTRQIVEVGGYYGFGDSLYTATIYTGQSTPDSIDKETTYQMPTSSGMVVESIEYDNPAWMYIQIDVEETYWDNMRDIITSDNKSGDNNMGISSMFTWDEDNNKSYSVMIQDGGQWMTAAWMMPVGSTTPDYLINPMTADGSADFIVKTIDTTNPLYKYIFIIGNE